MFYYATLFNQWNVSKVTNMENMFYSASSFNKNIINWNVSNVITMESMFCYATSFNRELDKWNISNVRNMTFMFYKATSFNCNLSIWNVSKCNVNNIFYETSIEFNKLNVKSFFENVFMNRIIKNKMFERIFIWARRANYIKFLTEYNYIIKVKKS